MMSSVMHHSSLAKEIGKRHPFESLTEEVMLNLWRTFTVLNAEVERLFDQYELCGTHYNILRILAGEKAAHDKGESGGQGEQCGLPVLEVRDRLITRVPDITRLVDKLEKEGLVSRVRTATDRRLVLLCITAKGQKLVEKIKLPLWQLNDQLLGHMPKDELKQLSRLLETARRGGASN